MFREMRHPDQSLSPEECEAILKKCEWGTLSVTGDEGLPYGVPINYVYSDGKLFFHCSPEGHLADALRHDSRVCFTVVEQAKLLPERLTTSFRSVVVFGRAALIEDPGETRFALLRFAFRFVPQYPKVIHENIQSCYDKMKMIAMDVERITGKASADCFEKNETDE